MATVYRVEADFLRFRSFTFAHISYFARQYHYTCQRLKNRWRNPKGTALVPKDLRRGDFAGVYGREPFAIDMKTAHLISRFVEQSCELLPLLFNGQEFGILHVVHLVDCLDGRRCKRNQKPPYVDKYHFHRTRFQNSLFKIPQTKDVETLCVQGLYPAENDFKVRVQRLRLKGLSFTKLWSSTD
jgi:hypothetical protein